MGTPLFCVFQVSPSGLPPASSPAICVTVMYIHAGCVTTATMDRVPTVVGGGVRCGQQAGKSQHRYKACASSVSWLKAVVFILQKLLACL